MHQSPFCSLPSTFVTVTAICHFMKKWTSLCRKALQVLDKL
ncbi:Protein of unknown function [Pyronema omphalodes CBS 100304]|uniref:Uncharacterized protein n=1 Tax=Pyronema omphalodes (strain CBS 100304) TaxID=1076935 RepID=U4L8G7_PYROM|nr:Protein of unknown function [Pyronema omphalodes CBS 100304]